MRADPEKKARFGDLAPALIDCFSEMRLIDSMENVNSPTASIGLTRISIVCAGRRPRQIPAPSEGAGPRASTTFPDLSMKRNNGRATRSARPAAYVISQCAPRGGKATPAFLSHGSVVVAQKRPLSSVFTLSIGTRRKSLFRDFDISVGRYGARGERGAACA